jgi:hypothetical protein
VNRTREAGNLDEIQGQGFFLLSTTCRAVAIRRRIIYHLSRRSFGEGGTLKLQQDSGSGVVSIAWLDFSSEVPLVANLICLCQP